MALMNLTVRFGLEMIGLGAIGLWAASLANPVPARVMLGLGAAIVLAVVWALVVAPKADNPIPQDLRVLVGSALLLAAAAALAFAGHPQAAAVFAVAIVVNTVLLFALPDGTPGALAAASSGRL